MNLFNLPENVREDLKKRIKRRMLFIATLITILFLNILDAAAHSSQFITAISAKIIMLFLAFMGAKNVYEFIIARNKK